MRGPYCFVTLAKCIMTMSTNEFTYGRQMFAEENTSKHEILNEDLISGLSWFLEWCLECFFEAQLILISKPLISPIQNVVSSSKGNAGPHDCWLQNKSWCLKMGLNERSRGGGGTAVVLASTLVRNRPCFCVRPPGLSEKNFIRFKAKN